MGTRSESASKEARGKVLRTLKLYSTFLAIMVGIFAALLYYGIVMILEGKPIEGWIQVIFSSVGLISSISLLNQIRTKVGLLRPVEKFEVVTVTECYRCDFKEVRRFEEGDYVMKKLGKCPKCKRSRIYISSIYVPPPSKGS